MIYVFRHLLSTVPPRAVQNNAYFLVDLDKLKDPQDILCDDLGAWEQSKTSTKSYRVERRNSGHVTKALFSEGGR